MVRMNACLVALFCALSTSAAAQVQLRISCAGAENDWLVGGLKVFKEQIDKSSPGQFNVQIHPASSLFRQGTEVPAIQRGNLEMSTMTTFEVEQQVPEYSVFSAGSLRCQASHAWRPRLACTCPGNGCVSHSDGYAGSLSRAKNRLD